jgi:hypothetical protein
MFIYVTLKEFSTLFSGRPNPPPLYPKEKKVLAVFQRDLSSNGKTDTPTQTQTPQHQFSSILSRYISLN